MTKIINYACFAIIIALASCKLKTDCSVDLFDMPIKGVYENSMDYVWSQKKILDSKLLSDMENMGAWEHKGSSGNVILSSGKSYEGKHSILLETKTLGPVNLPRGSAGALFKVNNEDWTDWNRVSFWIYPDLPGFKIVYINMIFYNDGEEKIPVSYGWDWHYQQLENHKWNKVNWEIAHYGRDRVTGIEIRYRLQGHELGATDTVRYYLDELSLEKVTPDHFEGWNIQSGEIAYNHSGYVKDFPKSAFTSEPVGQKFYLKEHATGKRVREGVVVAQTTPVGTFQMMDFSDLNEDGMYVLEVGKLKTKPFTIGTFSQVYRNSIIKTINHFYCQRCGFAIPGIHDACHLDFMCEHDGKTIPIHGGWHDAGDLSQGLVNTAEAAYAMMMLAEKLKKSDPILSDRLLEEAEWGMHWILRNRFEGGYKGVWNSMDEWTGGVLGKSDYNRRSRATKEPHANIITATAEAFAAVAFKDKNPFMAAYALQCAIEDYRFGFEIPPGGRFRMNAQQAGAALNAALALYEATSNETYKKEAIEHAGYILACQQLEDLDSNVPLKGFFHRTPEKDDIFHFPHRSHEQDFVFGLVKLSQLFPSESDEWKKALQLYAEYYKKICAYTAPYYMIPAGVYDLTKARNDEETEQIMRGVKLSDRYYMKRFPVWNDFRGNSGTVLSQAKGLAMVANFLQDKALLEIAIRAFDWHLGVNPFAQSLMYGEGYRYAPHYSPFCGNPVGGLPVGIQTYLNRDEPFWPAVNSHAWKEIWVHPSTRWLMLASNFF